ncbi:surface antigen-like protein [Chitinophaga skermanii]|uniref:Surface antigen-like protein n=1 Tax=Chitinophaga skermanii TaxID=331697 RepID=A0A327Q0P1_9BACT|nr:BamA/TamA family outer membrane protein [Chitinophaga skermanii]RAI97879.1 surface antigen-like protein [Chitinophaga skermanii]
MRIYTYLLFISASAILAACSTTRTVPEGDRLYTGADVKWDGKKPKDYSTLSDGVDDRIRPKPNKKFLGMPIKLWLYNLGNEPKGKGLNYLLRKKWGEAPVLLSSVKPNNTNLILEGYLEDKGYFNVQVENEIKHSGKKKAGIHYTIDPRNRYTIKSVSFVVDSSKLGYFIDSSKKFTLLKVGDNYDLDIIKDERERIHNILKEKGYYYFTPDYLLVQVDSTKSGQVDLYVKVKDAAPRVALRQYYMRKVDLYTNYTLGRDSLISEYPGRPFHGFTIYDPDSLYRPIVFERSVFLKEDSLYRLSSHNITLQRLMNLGTFKFVRGTFRPDRDSSYLFAKFYLTPYPKRSLQLELSGYSKSNNFIGSELKVSAKNRNWFKGANLLQITVGAGFETQVGGKNTQLVTNAYSLNLGVSVTFPRFISPIPGLNLRTPYVPRTRISASYELLSSPNLYNLNALNLQFGYQWKKTQFLDHLWNPISITYVLPSKITPEFQERLDKDPTLRQSIAKQFIIGGNYTLNFSNLSPERYHSFFASFNADVAGNLIGLVTKKDDDGQRKIFGQDYSQFARLSLEGRYYWKLSKNLNWVNRVFAGYGLPYGNSKSLPFVKQFFTGGSNSLRGFRARTLGPGSFRSDSSTYYANEAGDIKVEFNSELRYKLMKYIALAAFVDAGNIWLQKADSSKPGAQFKFNSFLNQTAVDAGIGLRIDASILVVRFDLAFPVRKPWLPSNERWVIDKINFGDPDWRKENLILNIAIGYPF